MAAETSDDTSITGPGAAPATAANSRLATLLRLPVLAVRRLGWGVVDQGVSSLTNFAVSIYIVHALGAVQFGGFSLAYVTYGFVLNASRGLATDPLMVRFAGAPTPQWRRAIAQCTGTSLLVGLAAGACVLAVGLALTGPTRAAFVALGLTLPALMLQDGWRFSFFTHGRGFHAFLNDCVWAVTLIPAMVILRITGHADVFTFTLAWGVTAGVGAVAGMGQARVVPRLSLAWAWLVAQRDLGARYLLEGTSNSAVIQVRGYGTGLILGLAALGYVQASVTLMGPVTILYLGMGLVTIPEGARVLRRSPRHFPLFCVLVSAGLALAGLAWGLVLLAAVPRGLGSVMLGSIWRSTYPLILPQMMYVVGSGLSGGAQTGLHALGAARQSLRVQLLTAGLSAVATLAGAIADGAAGTVYGMAIAALVNAVVMWWAFRKALHETAA